MGIVDLPGGRERGELERLALQRVLGNIRPGPPSMRVISRATPAGSAAFCSGCAGPIEFGAVVKGGKPFCSIECSLGGSSA